MKLIQLFEDSYFEDKIKILKNDCQPFLIQTDQLMYRGFSSTRSLTPVLDFDLFHGEVRKNRIPMTTPEAYHNLFNEYFEKKFGFKARSECLFTTGNKGFAKEYGAPYLIFPIGPFEFIWSINIYDLFMEISRFNIPQKPPEKITEYFKERLFGSLDDVNYQDTDLSEAIGSGNEIMVHCDQYYAIPADSELAEYIKKEGV